jgi:hypothetical protein
MIVIDIIAALVAIDFVSAGTTHEWGEETSVVDKLRRAGHRFGRFRHCEQHQRQRELESPPPPRVTTPTSGNQPDTWELMLQRFSKS